MQKTKVPNRGIPSAELQLHTDAVIRNVTYSTLASLSFFIKQVEDSPPSEAGWAGSVGLSLGKFVDHLRCQIGDKDESRLFYGKSPGNLFTLRCELLRVGRVQFAVSNALKANPRMDHHLPPVNGSKDATKEVAFWRGMAEHFVKGGACE